MSDTIKIIKVDSETGETLEEVTESVTVDVAVDFEDTPAPAQPEITFGKTTEDADNCVVKIEKSPKGYDIATVRFRGVDFNFNTAMLEDYEFMGVLMDIMENQEKVTAPDYVEERKPIEVMRENLAMYDRIFDLLVGGNKKEIIAAIKANNDGLFTMQDFMDLLSLLMSNIKQVKN